jgi:glucosyl-3-phosphoglycerate phosphatase
MQAPTDRPCALVVRHGLTFWNAEQRWQGRADIDLNPDGIAQARAAALTLDGMPVDRIISSNLSRARQTAQELRSGLVVNVPEILVDDRFAERDIGDWSGLLTGEIEERWPGRLDAWRSGEAPIPGGEDEEHLAERILAGLRDALESVRAQSIPLAVIVSHGGVMRALDRLTDADQRSVRNLEGRWFWLDETDAIVAGGVVSLARNNANSNDTIAASEAARGTSL